MLKVFEQHEASPEVMENTTSTLCAAVDTTTMDLASCETVVETCAMTSLRHTSLLFQEPRLLQEALVHPSESVLPGKGPVHDLIHAYVRQEEAEEALYIADLGNVTRQHRRWLEELPQVEPFYAIKCNSDPYILKTLALLGTGFDCASKGEIEMVLSLGVSPDRIIFANPCKPASHIQYARHVGVKMMTFDNAAELSKVKQHYPEAELVLRILTDDSKSACRFGVKFGTHPGQTKSLLQMAMALGLNVVGVSFHVGSGCFDASAYSSAVQRARHVFDEAEQIGYHFRLLDIGGGFPGSESGPLAFKEIATVLNRTLTELFPANVRVISEPGRYYACGVLTLAVNVTSRRVMTDESGQLGYMYYVNDGVYGSFNCLLFDHAVLFPEWYVKAGKLTPSSHHGSQSTPAMPLAELPVFRSSIWGPTCDSIDCITKEALLPELDVGDWLLFEKMGAYTVAASSTFNGFLRPRVQYINTENEDLRPFDFDQ